jgi:hypothetical protein
MDSTNTATSDKVSLKDMNYIIDVDKVKECYAKLNPEKKPLTNSALAKLTGKTPQYFTDLQNPNKRKPDTPLFLLKLCELSGQPLGSLIVEVKENDE